MCNIDSFKQDGYTYYRLYIKCPICNQQGRNVPPVYWAHANCPVCPDGGDIYMGENAFYLCKDCGHKEHLMKWRYWCQYHSQNDDDYVLLTDKAIFADVVAAAGALVTAAGIPWLTTLLQNL